MRPATVIRRAAPTRPTQIKVEAPEETQVVFGDVSAKPVNGVLVVDLKSMTQPTTVNLVIRDSGKKDLVIPVAMTPGSRPQGCPRRCWRCGGTRAGKPAAEGSLDDEWAAIAGALRAP